jgi:hypothetical protein
MRLQLRHILESLQESHKVAAVLLELPPTVHLHQREELHAGGADQMGGG